MCVGSPSIEIADDAYLRGVGRPHREVHTGAAVNLAAVRAKLVVRAVQRAFTEQVQIEFSKHASVLHFHGAFGDERCRAADADPGNITSRRLDRNVNPARAPEFHALQIQQ